MHVSMLGEEGRGGVLLYTIPYLLVLQHTLWPPLKPLLYGQGLGVQLVEFVAEFLCRLGTFEFEAGERGVSFQFFLPDQRRQELQNAKHSRWR